MTDFSFTRGQENFLVMLQQLMKAPTPMPAVLTGFSGTGKTTMIKAIASEYGPPLVLAPTGKAALRVHEATGLEALTIHRWMYQVMEDPETGALKFRRKDHNTVQVPFNRLIVVDEASMVGRDLWEDLWDMCQILGLRILLVGDTFQLAPVEMDKGDDPNFVPFASLSDVETPFRAHLSEITRQALDNPILRASMMLRESSNIAAPLKLLNRVFTKNFEDKCMEVYQDGGAILVHKNTTRHRLNKVVRSRLGYGDDLRPGEPLLVLRNTYEIDRFNGEVIPFQGWDNYDASPKAVRDNWRKVSLMLSFGLANVDGQRVMLCPEQVRGEAFEMTESVIGRNSKYHYGDWYAAEGEVLHDPETKTYLGPPHLHANLGYALTAHKAQGSEWGKVLVLIENSVRPTTYEGRRWTYTALTRAKESCYFAMEV